MKEYMIYKNFRNVVCLWGGGLELVELKSGWLNKLLFNGLE